MALLRGCSVRLIRLVAVVSALFGAAAPAGVHAQPASVLKPVVQANRVGVVNTASRVAVPGHLPAWVDRSALAGTPVSATEPVELTLVLRRSDAAEAAFQELLADQQTPGSAMYHHAVSPDQQGVLYGPTAHDLAAVTDWAASQGLTVAEVSPSRTAVRLTGTVTAVEGALHVHFSNYRTGDGSSKARRAPDSEPLVPAALAGIIRAIGGLTVENPHPDIVAQGNGAQPQFYAASNGRYYVTPADFAKIYDVNPVYAANNTGATTAGAAQHVAIVANSDVNPQDIQAFFAGIGRTNVTYNVVYANGTAPGYTAGQGEAELDIERVLGTAPGVTVDLVEGLTTASSAAIYNAASYAVNTLRDPVVTMSFGECEPSLGAANAAKWQNLWATAAANMTSVFVSGGDSGAAACDPHGMAAPATPTARAINGYCSTVSNTCVGGTEFNDSANPSQYWSMTNDPTTRASALGYIPEGAWNDPTRTDANGNLIYYISAGGGGASQFVTKPAWQTGTGVPADGQRDTPDISLTASAYHDPYYYCGPGECNAATQRTQFVAYGNGGTSASSPSMAAIAALLNTAAGTPQGNLNPMIYRLAGSSVAGQVFHDVTLASSGVANCDVTVPSLCNNTVPGANSATGGTVGFAVGTGYDQATGWGSLDVANFIRAAVPVNTSLALAVSGTAVGTAQTVTATATLTAAASSLAAPTGTVQFLVNGVAAGAPVTLAGTTATSAIISFPSPGTYTLTAVYSGDALYVGSSAAAVTVTVTAQPPALALALGTPALSFPSGATSGNSTAVMVTGSNNFAGVVALSCAVSAVPAGSVPPTCAVSPGNVTLAANGSATATVTINSAAAQALLAPVPAGRSTVLACAACLGLAGFVFSRRRRLPLLAAWLLMLCGVAGMTGCGGSSGNKPGPSAGGYSVVLTATGTGMGALTPSTATTTLSVTIQ